MIPCKPTACDDRSRLYRAIESGKAQARRGAALTPTVSHGERGVDSRWRGNDGEGRNDRVTVTNTPVLTQGERREMIRAQLVGATGYGGLGMVELLVGHPEISLVSLLAKNDVGQPISAFFPHLRGLCDLPVEEATPERVGRDVDLVICATPDRIGMGYAPALRRRGRCGARLQRRLPLSECR